MKIVRPRKVRIYVEKYAPHLITFRSCSSKVTTSPLQHKTVTLFLAFFSVLKQIYCKQGCRKYLLPFVTRQSLCQNNGNILIRLFQIFCV